VQASLFFVHPAHFCMISLVRPCRSARKLKDFYSMISADKISLYPLNNDKIMKNDL